jgi:hypothetical protein
MAEKRGRRQAVANDIVVRLPSIHQRPYPDIARDAVAALRAELPVTHDNIKLTVEDAGSHWKVRRTGSTQGVLPKVPVE